MEPTTTNPDGSPYRKTCTRCKLTKVAEEAFHKSNSTHDGWHSRCKQCRKKAYQEMLKAKEGIQPGDLTLPYPFRGKKRAPRKLKRCPGCDTVKPASEFHKNKGRSDGLRSYCKPCALKKNRQGVTRQALRLLKDELSKAHVAARKYQLLHERFPKDEWYAHMNRHHQKRLVKAQQEMAYVKKHGEMPPRDSKPISTGRRGQFEERMTKVYTEALKTMREENNG